MKKNFDQEKNKVVKYFEPMSFSYPIHPAHYVYKAELIRKYAKGVVLDAGCADGTYLPLIQEKAKKVYGIDTTPEMVTAAIFKTRTHKKIMIRDGDITQLEFKDDFFDVIFCQSTFYYIKDQEKAFVELLRVLKPKGILIIDVRYQEGSNRRIQEYTMDGEWLRTLPTITFLDEYYPPQVGILPIIRKFLGNSVPPITTHVIQKV